MYDIGGQFLPQCHAECVWFGLQQSQLLCKNSRGDNSQSHDWKNEIGKYSKMIINSQKSYEMRNHISRM